MSYIKYIKKNSKFKIAADLETYMPKKKQKIIYVACIQICTKDLLYHTYLSKSKAKKSQCTNILPKNLQKIFIHIIGTELKHGDKKKYALTYIYMLLRMYENAKSIGDFFVPKGGGGEERGDFLNCEFE